MTEQWLRKCSLIVADQQGDGIELSSLKVEFHTEHQTTSAPKLLTARVWNLSEDTVSKIKEMGTPSPPSTIKDGPQILLQAGYEGNFATIFRGNIKQIIKGRTGPENSFIDLFAADGDLGWTYSTVNKTLSKGWAQEDIYKLCQEALAPYGIQPGTAPTELQLERAARGKACFGMTRDLLKSFAFANLQDWTIHDGVMLSVPQTSYLPDDAIVLNARTGVIGVPSQSETGIYLKCLLNPAIKWGATVKLDNASIIQALYPNQPSNLGFTGSNVNRPTPLSTNDGLYKVWKVSHYGDTRDTPWYTDIVCLGIDQTGGLLLPPGVTGTEVPLPPAGTH